LQDANADASTRVEKTIGIVMVDTFAARAEAVPPVAAITAT
jgi:hypothetical protein